MRKQQPATVLAIALIKMDAMAAFDFSVTEIAANGHDTLFLALDKMLTGIKKRFKDGNASALNEAKMIVELGQKLQDSFGTEAYYISFSIKMGDFAEKLIKHDPTNENAIELRDFVNVIRKR